MQLTDVQLRKLQVHSLQPALALTTIGKTKITVLLHFLREGPMKFHLTRSVQDLDPSWRRQILMATNTQATRSTLCRLQSITYKRLPSPLLAAFLLRQFTVLAPQDRPMPLR